MLQKFRTLSKINRYFNTVFPVVVLVFDFEEFSEEVLHGHACVTSLKLENPKNRRLVELS
jgi:hypothetical protein